MIDGRKIGPRDIDKLPGEQLTFIDTKNLMPLPAPFDNPDTWPKWQEAKPEWKEKYAANLDGIIGIDCFETPKTKEEQDELVRKFLSGVEKMLSAESNKGIIQCLNLSMEYCAKCNTCANACHVFEASGYNEIYRPTYRAEVLRMIVKKYFTKSGKLMAKFVGADIDLTWEVVARLGESAYRCNLCRRCNQTCPLALDNSLFAKEIRKIFSQEMGIAPKPIFEKGDMLQLKTGSSTGVTKAAFLDTVEFLDEDCADLTGYEYTTPIDKKGADILLIHNAGEFMAWPENPMAFTILFEEAGLDWTLSSDLMGYDNVNYGIWHDDMLAKKIAVAQNEAAKKLGVQRIVIAECGHAHKAAAVVADRFYPGKDRVPVQSFLPLLRDLVMKGTYDLDPSRNNFLTTLHDPCNYVRQMGIVKPQRDILNAVMPKGNFHEMEPHGVNNYCCGGGSGFAIMNSMNFSYFRNNVSARKKLSQILNAFGEASADPSVIKYITAPCSNCKGTMRDLLEAWHMADYNFYYGGLVELVVNAMTKFDEPFLEFLRDE